MFRSWRCHGDPGHGLGSCAATASMAALAMVELCENLVDEMNPKRVYGSYTLEGIIVV